MKAAYLSGPYDLRVEEVEIPKASRNLVLIRSQAVGICGSDIACYEGESNEGRYDIAPYIPGHEWAGEVVEVGENVSTLKKGDRVSGVCVLRCGVCENCLQGLPHLCCKDFREVGFMPNTPGGMGEYLIREEGTLYKLAENMTYEEGALIEPFSIAYYAIWGNQGYVRPTDDVVIFGAGPIGLFDVIIVKAAGAKVIVVEPVARNRQMAMDFGADVTINPKKENVNDLVLDLTEGRGASLIIEASGADQALAACFEISGPLSRVRLIGHSTGRRVPVEIGLIIWKGVSIFGLGGGPDSFPATIKFMENVKEKVDYSQVITHRFPLEKVKDAFEFSSNKEQNGVIKAMITM